MNAPSVTVVIPLFDKAPYVARAVKSVLAQTEPRFELIVVDDGSTDGGPEVVLRLADARLRLLRQPRSGVSAARNRGVAEARTEFVAFLDADDEWHPEFLEQTLHAVGRAENAVAAFTNYSDAGSGRPFLETAPPAPQQVDDYCAFVLRNAGRGALASAILVRRAALLESGGFPEGVHRGEDQDACCRLGWTGPLRYLPRPLAVYHSDVPGAATALQKRDGPDFPVVADTYAAWREAGRVPERLLASGDRYAREILASYVIELLNRGRRTEARALLTERTELSDLPWPVRIAIGARARVPAQALSFAVAAYRALRRSCCRSLGGRIYRELSRRRRSASRHP